MVVSAFCQADSKKYNQQHQNMPSIGVTDTLDVRMIEEVLERKGARNEKNLKLRYLQTI